MEILENFRRLSDKHDPRTEGWFLVSSPGTLVAIVSFYIYFCVSLGPRCMKDKQPYSLRKTLIVYNFVQVLLSIYLLREGLSVWLFEYNWTCQPVDYSDSPSAMRVARGTHLYFVCKLVELLDTLFFVLRKKDRQISFLHLYHHALMPLASWIAVRYFAGGHPTLLGTINSFVHVVMYAYYMLAAFGPEVQKYLWWKKYLTLLQIVQFIVIGLHSAQMLFTDCNFPKLISTLMVIESFVFIYMFGSFYVRNNLKQNTRTVVNSVVDDRQSLKSD